MAELVAQLPGTCYVTRQAAHTPGAVRQLRRAIKKGFQNQAARKGTTFIEIMGTCNSGWKISPTESNTWMVDNMFPFYQLGDLKDE
jgi:2-oxoglutarate ferredoxin oxidoreductase subunit beta